jgi:type III pantothenate kinase
MTPDVVVDIGNSRVKWGVCRDGRVAEVLRLRLGDVPAWDAAAAGLPPPGSSARRWAVASVNPPALDRFLAWAQSHGRAEAFADFTQLPIRVVVDEPGKVGIDRLFGAVAAKAMVPPGAPAITVDVGTAVTVNLVDAGGAFQGGAIFPGPRLMARALREFTAKLPLVELSEPLPPEKLGPGKNTAAAIRLGLESTLRGGVGSIVGRFAADHCPVPPWLFLTGGAHPLLVGHALPGVAAVRAVPTLTLEGIRIAAGGLP